MIAMIAGRTGTSLNAGTQSGCERCRKELFYRYGKTYVQTLGEQDLGEALLRSPAQPVLARSEFVPSPRKDQVRQSQ